MNQYPPPEGMYDYHTDRSPTSMRYNGSVQRQSSRHFAESNYGGSQPGLYTAEDHHSRRYDPGPLHPQEYRAPPSHGQYPASVPYDNQTWSYAGPHGGNTMGGTGRMKPPNRRAALPTTWDAPIPPVPQFGLGLNGLLPGLQPLHQQNHNPRHDAPSMDGSDELIATAIVIKNIPFAVKKEQLQQIMTEMNLPLPYAFNYHFDNGVFRGLAFANFTTADETTAVINIMNGMELSGRKLRVEYKKMLPAAERDRIERDKRERRGQLQEQHQPISNGQLHSQASINSLSSHPPAQSPSPLSSRNTSVKEDVDLNDPTTLDFYTQLTLFKNDPNREVLVFPNHITPTERRIIHTLAHNMGLEHRSEGSGEHRQVQIFKMRINTGPALSQISPYYNESRRGLNRAATVDFTENRAMDSNYDNITLRRQGSNLLDVPASPGAGGLLPTHGTLRGAKSFADLRSYSPSPSLSNGSSFPSSLAHNVSKYSDNFHSTGGSGTPNLTPTSAGPSNERGETLILHSLSSMSIRDDRQLGTRSNYTPASGPIGSQRPVNGNYDDTPRNGASAVPQRQPKGPSGNEWGQSGFSSRRQNGHVNRGSGELDSNSLDKIWDDNRR